MDRRPVKNAWFDALTAGGNRSRFEWLRQLHTISPIQTIANFGCCSAEPMILLWLLDAVEVNVVEAKKENLAALKEDLEILTKTREEALQGRTIRLFAPRDMAEGVSDLPPNYFDLAYCDRVLYSMSPDLNRIQRAINEMARVVKPGKFVVAVDERVDSKGASATGNPIDISSLFEAAGLNQIRVTGMPDWSYCYLKPLG